MKKHFLLLCLTALLICTAMVISAPRAEAAEPHTHCLCGGLGNVGDHTSCEDVTWTEWTSTTTLPKATGHYYLSKDVTLTAMQEVPATVSVDLCLNGHKVLGPTNAYIYRVRKNLTICDCAGGGQLVSRNADSAGTAGCIYVFNNSSSVGRHGLTLFGGTLTKSNAEPTLGAMVRFGNTTDKDNSSDIFFKMYGGTICGGRTTGASNWSAGVYMYRPADYSYNSEFYMYGGTITDNVSGNSAYGDGVIIDVGVKAYFSGDAQIYDNGTSNLYLKSGATITVGDLTEDAKIGVTVVAGNGEFGTYTGTVPADTIYSDTVGKEVVAAGGKLIRQNRASTHTDHCICGGTGLHGTCADVTWEPWPTDNKPVMDGTHYYYLTQNVTASASIAIGSETDHASTLHLCLNGFQISGSVRPFKVYGTLDLCDCTGKGVLTGSSTSLAPAIYVYEGGTWNLFGGTVTASKKSTNTNGGGVCCVNGTVKMYGGTVTGGQTVANGGNIMLYGASSFYMYGGTISGGKADGYGGNIAIPFACKEIVIAGGTITGGSAKCGGNIYLKSNTEVKLGAVTISDGVANDTAKSRGGNVYIGSPDARVTMENTTLTGGSAMHGHSVALIAGKLKLKGNVVMKSTEDIYTDLSPVVAYRLTDLDLTELNTTESVDVYNQCDGYFAHATEAQIPMMKSAKTGGLAFTVVNGDLYCSAPGSTKICNSANRAVGSYYCVAEAVKHLQDGQYIKIEKETIDMVQFDGDALYLDLAGRIVRGRYTLKSGAFLYGMNSITDDYTTAASIFYGDVEGGKVATATRGSNLKRYLMTNTSGTTTFNDGTGYSKTGVPISRYTFDRFYVGITAMQMNVTTGDVGYNGVVAGNAKVQAALAEENAFGFRIRLDGGENAEVGCAKSEFATGMAGNRKTLTVENQLACIGENPELANVKVIGSVYIRLADGTVISGSDYAYDLPTMMKMTDDSFDTLSIQEKNCFRTLYNRYPIMKDWGLNAVDAYGMRTLTMRYDDRISLEEIGLEGTPKIENKEILSKTVDGKDDTAVVTVKDGKLYATAVGKATVTFDNGVYEITVEPAPISLFMVTGHSVGVGEQGDAAQSIVCPDGMVYSSYEGNKVRCLSDAEIPADMGLGAFAASRPAAIDALTAGGGGATGNVSGVASKWVELTGEKIWILNAAKGGSTLEQWQLDADIYSDTVPFQLYGHAVSLYQKAEQILKAEIAAGHYTLSHMGILQNTCANGDQNWDTAKYLEYFFNVWNGFKKDLACDLDGDGKTETVECIGLSPIWTRSSPLTFSNGKRINYVLAASPEYPEIFLAGCETRNWTNTVNITTYFERNITYTTQNGTPITPAKTLDDIYPTDNVHYLQVAYNAAGMEIGENLYRHFYGEPATETLTLFASDGSEILQDKLTVAAGGKTYAVPACYPCCASDITVKTTGGVTFNNGTITVSSNGTVEFTQNGKTLRTLTITTK